jgi:hypothetical protein
MLYFDAFYGLGLFESFEDCLTTVFAEFIGSSPAACVSYLIIPFLRIDSV